MKFTRKQINLPNQEVQPFTPLDGNAKMYSDENGSVYWLDDLGINRQIQTNAPIVNDYKNMWIVDDFINNLSPSSATQVFRCDAQLQPIRATRGSEAGVIGFPLSATLNAQYGIFTNSEFALPNGFVFEGKFLLKRYGLLANIGFSGVTSVVISATGTIAVHINNGTSTTPDTLTGLCVSNTNGLIRSQTPTSWPLAVDTWYIARTIISEDRTKVTFKLFDDMYNLLWEDIVTTNIPEESTTYTVMGHISMAWGVDAVSTYTLGAYYIDYAGFGSIEGYYRHYGVMP